MQQVIYRNGVFEVIGGNTAPALQVAPATGTAPASPAPSGEAKPICRKLAENKLLIQKWEKATWVLSAIVMVLAGLTFMKFLTKE